MFTLANATRISLNTKQTHAEKEGEMGEKENEASISFRVVCHVSCWYKIHMHTVLCLFSTLKQASAAAVFFSSFVDSDSHKAYVHRAYTSALKMVHFSVSLSVFI